MIYIAVGCLAFICYVIFDLNKIKFIHRYINVLFIFGSAVLFLCTVAIIASNHSKRISAPLQWLALLLAFLSLILLIYTIFGAIPFKKTYIETKKGNTVVDTGMYALCRHPGVLWFFFFYILLSLAFRNKLLLTAALVWTCLDIIYVYIQDRWLFPIILEDYQTYQKQVPFLKPNMTSLRNCMSSLRGKVIK